MKMKNNVISMAYSSLTLLTFILYFCGCDNTPKDMRLTFDALGNVNIAGKDTKLVSKIGSMDAEAVKHLKEPERGVTRLIVRNKKAFRIPDNVFDIHFTGNIDVKGNGTYRLNKPSSSNVWLLEINGDDVQELSIVEGAHGATTDYSTMGWVLIIFGIILMVIGFFTMVAGGIGCLIKIIGLVLIIIGYNLLNPAT